MGRLLGVALLATLVCAGLAGSSGDRGPQSLSLKNGWDVWLDPAGAGAAQGWTSKRPDVPAQATLNTGLALDAQGIPNYSGVVWYQKNVTIPRSWRRVVIGFGALDVRCEVYVNGQFAGAFDDKGLGQRAASVDITIEAHPGETALIVFRLVATGGAGGIKQEVKLGQDEAQVMSPEQYILFLQQQHPDWRLPNWASSGHRAWVVTGVEGAASKGVAGLDGVFSPAAGTYSVSFWLFDPETRQVLPFPLPRASLRDGSSPMPVFDFSVGPWQLREELTGYGPPESPAVGARVTLVQGPHGAVLFAALRPYSASPGSAPLRQVQYRNGQLSANGHLALACLDCAGVRGGALAGGDSAALADRGVVPQNTNASSSDGWAQGLMSLPIAPGASVSFAAPSQPSRSLPAGLDFEGISRDWQQRLHAVRLDLPDQDLQNAYYSSLAYILVDEHSGLIHPGPLLHDRFWVRDAAMIGYALERAGLAGAATRSAEALLGTIDAGGHVTAITSSDGRPQPPEELDAPGQAVFGLVEYARFSGDSAFLGRSYPAMVVALERAMAGRDALGLVPPNLSAEDLGPANQHHYWDDLWLLTGLADARWAADELHKNADEERFAQQAEELRSALLASIARDGADIIPNGPEDLESSAMARGASPALWPLPVLDAASPLVRQSFQAYMQRFIEPNGGAYRHIYGQWWPYGGLEIAHDLLFLGMRQQVRQVLDFTLQHPTAPGLWAWAEGVDPASGSLAEGDMPHAWAAAELVNLVRDMLLYEDGDRLVIGAGVPASWQGQAFSARNLPTRWGTADLAVDQNGLVHLSGVVPPGGVRLDLPFAAELAPR